MRSPRSAGAAFLLVLSLACACAVALALPTASLAAGRITGGAKAPDAQYQSHLRSLVALVSLDEPSQYDGQFCAGTLIDELHVLTAGHCLVDDGDLRTRISPTSFAVLAGTPNLSKTSLRRSELVPVQSMFINPNFNVRTMRWDVAVLRLTRPITNVPVAPLLSPEEAAALGLGTSTFNGLVAGWGDTDPDFDDCCFPFTLQSVAVPLHPDSECTGNLAAAPYLSFSGEFQLCAGRLGRGTTFGADACQGDSGGPLYVDAAGGPRLAGVTSFGVGCGQRFYGVYARATTIMPWLASIPGATPGDAREAINGPGDLAAPAAVASRPVSFDKVELTITPATTGAAASGYTMWARVGAPAVAEDIFLGKTTSLTARVTVPPINVAHPYDVLVRPVGDSGEGPTARVKALPVLDQVKPTVPGGLRVANKRATWRASIDRQSLIHQYQVQVFVGGSWRAPKVVKARTFAIGSASKVRVRSMDWADNVSAWSAPVSA
ncbi:MAG: trypsin domain lipoprotein [Thermoleophilia bacterium]|nr:trypsin domain lipoprotein [Thermoleophilia bacterium]